MTPRKIEARISSAPQAYWRVCEEVERNDQFVRVLYRGRFYNIPPERVRERVKK